MAGQRPECINQKEINTNIQDTQMIVDTREHALIDELNKINFAHEVKALDLGDISMDEFGLVFERKTLSDLQSSIIDGRYKEQGYRLSNSSYHPHNVIYIIEGSFTDYKYKNCDKQIILSAMTSLQYYKGFSIIRSMNIAETASILFSIYSKIKKEKKPAFYIKPTESQAEPSQEEQLQSDKNYTKYVNKVKGRNITKNNIQEIMLMQIPGISDISAKYIINEFKDIPTLVSKIKENPAAITDFKYLCEKTNKQKKINKTIADNIIKFLI